MTVRRARTRQYPWRSVAPFSSVIGGFGRGLAANKHKFLNKFHYEYIPCLDYGKGWKKSEKTLRKSTPKRNGSPGAVRPNTAISGGPGSTRKNLGNWPELARTKNWGSGGLGDLTSKGVYCQPPTCLTTARTVPCNNTYHFWATGRKRDARRRMSYGGCSGTNGRLGDPSQVVASDSDSDKIIPSSGVELLAHCFPTPSSA
jgi:hypothetical protein